MLYVHLYALGTRIIIIIIIRTVRRRKNEGIKPEYSSSWAKKYFCTLDFCNPNVFNMFSYIYILLFQSYSFYLDNFHQSLSLSFLICIVHTHNILYCSINLSMAFQFLFELLIKYLYIYFTQFIYSILVVTI